MAGQNTFFMLWIIFSQSSKSHSLPCLLYDVFREVSPLFLDVSIHKYRVCAMCKVIAKTMSSIIISIIMNFRREASEKTTGRYSHLNAHEQTLENIFLQITILFPFCNKVYKQKTIHSPPSLVQTIF